MVTLTAVPQGPVRLRGKAIDKLALSNLAIAADIVRFSAKCLRQIDVLSRIGLDDQAPLHRRRIIEFDFALQYPLGDQHAGVLTPLSGRLALGCHDLVEVGAGRDPELEAIIRFRVLRHITMKDRHDWPPLWRSVPREC